MKILILTVGLISLSYAVDISTKTNQEQVLKQDESINIKKNQSQTKENKKSDSTSKTASTSYEINFKPTSIYLQLADECVQDIKAPVDFGLSSEVDGGFDIFKQELLEISAKANRPIKEVGADEDKLKKYISCIIDNSARIIQANLYFQGHNISNTNELNQKAKTNFLKAKEIKDISLLEQVNEAKKSLQSNCRFLNSMDKIQCKSLVFDLSTNELKFANLTIYDSSNLENFFGISTALKLTVSKSNSTDLSSSIAINQSNSKDVSQQETKSISKNISTEQNISTQGFIPKGN